MQQNQTVLEQYAVKLTSEPFMFKDVLVCPKPCILVHTLYSQGAYPPLFSSRGRTQKSTTIDFPQRKAKLLSYLRKHHDSNLTSCSSTSRNPSSPFRGAGVLGPDVPPQTHLHFSLYTQLSLSVMRQGAMWL